MGTWYMSLVGCLLLVFIGLYTHWTVIVIGALLPFVPLVTYVLKRRRGGPPES